MGIMADATADAKTSLSYVVLIIIITIIGSLLRLYQLGGQIIGDDEWHAIIVAGQSSYSYIFTHFNANDNCIPLTLIYKLLLDTVGLNEMTLHILQATVGILGILVCSQLAAKVIGKQASLIFAFLLSLSPVLIYYSRFARPYIFVVILSFTALMFFYFWLESNKRWYSIGYVAGGILSSYFSQVSFPSLATPLLFSLLILLLKKSVPASEPKFNFSAREVLIVGGALGCGILAWLLPTLGSVSKITSKVGKGEIQLSTFSGCLKMFNGFGNPWIVLTLMVVAVVGLFHLHRRNKGFFYFVISIILVQVISITLLSPDRVELPHVFARYNLSCLPFYLMLVSVGILSTFNTIYTFMVKAEPTERTVTVLAISFLSVLYISCSPLKTIYASTNNFSNHDDFQYDYTSELFDSVLDTNKISRFYRDLRNENKDISIIEYPYVVQWSGNFYHFYQQIHGKRVSIGFWKPYYLLSQVGSNQQVNLRNFVSFDPDTLIKSGAKYVIIHKNIALEALHARDLFKGGNGLDPEAKVTSNILDERHGPLSRRAARLTEDAFHQYFSKPCFEDEWITVFRMPVREEMVHGK